MTDETRDFVTWRIFWSAVIVLAGFVGGAYAFSYGSLTTHQNDLERHLSVRSVTSLDERYMSRREMSQLQQSIAEMRTDIKTLVKENKAGK